jgi:hypothetical protein
MRIEAAARAGRSELNWDITMTNNGLAKTAARTATRLAAGLIVAALASGLTALRAEPVARSMVPIVVPRDQKPARERLEANVQEVLKTLQATGTPVSAETRAALARNPALSDFAAVGAIQAALDKYVLLTVGLNDEAWFTLLPASPSPKDRVLVQRRWKTFLVKLDNSSRVTSPLGVRSAQAITTLSEENDKSGDTCVEQPHDWSHWFLMRLVGPPLMPALMSGKEVEYFAIQLCSLDAGDRSAEFTFYLGGGQVSQGHYGSTVMLFRIDESAASQ